MALGVYSVFSGAGLGVWFLVWWALDENGRFCALLLWRFFRGFSGVFRIEEIDYH